MKFAFLLSAISVSAAFSAEINLDLPVLAGRGNTATVVLENLAGSKRYVFNPKRATIRYSPASTFKILNTLIALEEKAVSNAETVVSWDGTQYEFPDWNRDQTLRSAFRVSCVWFYQLLAEKVTLKKYQDYLHKIGYGNARTGNAVKTFWLDSSLRISAREQISFLKDLQANRIPVSVRNASILREIMLAENRKNFRLFSKTGWVMQAEPQIGWYVGFIETDDDAWFFAINLDLRTKEDLKLRQAILDAALAEAAIRR